MTTQVDLDQEPRVAIIGGPTSSRTGDEAIAKVTCFMSIRGGNRPLQPRQLNRRIKRVSKDLAQNQFFKAVSLKLLLSRQYIEATLEIDAHLSDNAAAKIVRQKIELAIKPLLR